MAETRPYITCQELIDFLYLYLEGELPEDRRLEFERHLKVCPDCVNYVEQYRATMRLCAGALADSGAPAPADMPPGLAEAILAAHRKS
jgi:anti-sigma factor RsiW